MRHDKVRFGSAVTVRLDGGGVKTLRIVGEDEANPGEGLISYVAPVAARMIGAALGERVTTGAAEGEIIAIG